MSEQPVDAATSSDVATHAASATAKERTFPCHKCGADLVYSPGVKSLQCPYCGHAETVPQTEQEIKEYSFNDYLRKPKSLGYGAVPGARQEAKCQSCGAASQIDANLRATRCAYCSGPLIIDDKPGVVDVITPEAVVPFRVTRNDAESAFRAWLKSLWFAPTALKGETQARQLQGIYRPYWTYDAYTVSHWTGERGDHYYVTESYTATENGKNVTKTRQVRKTRWTYVSGVYSEFFDDVLIAAGQNKDQRTTYELGKLEPYAPEFLSGFNAERYVVSCEQGWVEAKNVIADEIRDGVRRQIGGDEQRIHSVTTAYNGVKYKHILLPLWISCYTYAAKNYCFQVNGQSGEVKGERPYSFWKIATLVLAILAAIAVIVLLTNR
jgi:DNA-directed RNA polymerase subunit RPC12/RpoP